MLGATLPDSDSEEHDQFEDDQFESVDHVEDNTLVMNACSFMCDSLCVDHQGIASSSPEIMARYLIYNGADCTLRNREGKTALDLTTDPALRRMLIQTKR